MLINKCGDVLSLEKDKLLCYETDSIQHYIDGFVFISGHESGETSLREIQRCISLNNKIPFNKMYGSFIYLMIIKGKKMLFPCDSMLRSIYISDYAVSNSFLELLLYHKEIGAEIVFDDESVSEYYSLGNIYFGKTFVKGISILPNDKYVIWESGNLSICDKGIGDIDAPSGIQDPKQFFHDLGLALKNKRVAISLTGGYDSRMVFALTNKSVDPYLFFSANVETRDGNTAEKVAQVAGKTLNIIKTDKPKLTEEFIIHMIENSDGMQPLDLNNDCRLNNARNELKKLGFNLQLTGDGGVLHKDWEWMQDLPFYHKKKTDLRKFYHQRIAFSFSAPFCGNRIREVISDQEKRIITQMKAYVKNSNTQSYDALYYYVNGNRNSRYNYVGTKEFTLYAPLNELDLVRYSYHLPRSRRFFYNFIREMTTYADKKIARVPTNYGTTASSEKIYCFRDFFVQLKEYAVKAIRMFKRKFHLKSSGESVMDWSLEEDFRGLNITLDAVEWAQKERFIADDAMADKIPFPNLMRLVHLYILSYRYNIR